MIEKLLSPINARQPAGSCDEDYQPLEQLEDLMLKYGSLHQSSINWEQVQTLGMQILQNQCKHYRVLLHLITYWLNKRSVDGLLDSLKLLSGFLEQYWTNGYPKPGNANVRYRKKLTEQILFRMDQASQRLLKDIPPRSLIEPLDTAWSELDAQIKKRKLETRLTKLNSRLAELKKTAQTTQVQQADNTAKTTQTAPTGFSTRLTDLGDERQIKRLLFDLADMINRQHVDDSLGYQLRRYALWSGIQSTPPVNKQGESELLPPPVDVIQEYDELIKAGSISITLLHRIEKSLVASPFWLTGSLYTVSSLRMLNHQGVAQIVMQMLEKLLNRLPALTKDKFRGGLPYLNQSLLKKLRTNPVRAQAGTRQLKSVQNVSSWDVLQNQWQNVRKKQGIASVLEQVEKHQQRADTPREMFYLKLLASEQLQAAGLKQTAKDLLATTLERVEKMSVSEWEPDYLQRAQTLLERE